MSIFDHSGHSICPYQIKIKQNKGFLKAVQFLFTTCPCLLTYKIPCLTTPHPSSCTHLHKSIILSHESFCTIRSHPSYQNFKEVASSLYCFSSFSFKIEEYFIGALNPQVFLRKYILQAERPCKNN